MLCPFCKTQTSRLIDNYQKFRALDAEVLVVYPGTRDHVDEFIEAAKKTEKRQVDEVPFPIVLDEEMKAVDFFSIRSNLAHPSTYVIDKKGNVKLAYVGKDMSADRPSVNGHFDADRSIQQLRVDDPSSKSVVVVGLKPKPISLCRIIDSHAEDSDQCRFHETDVPKLPGGRRNSATSNMQRHALVNMNINPSRPVDKILSLAVERGLLNRQDCDRLIREAECRSANPIDLAMEQSLLDGRTDRISASLDLIQTSSFRVTRFWISSAQVPLVLCIALDSSGSTASSL